ncbi:uncharacterized protein LOC144178956 [Haemaphysalis longicornis]
MNLDELSEEEKIATILLVSAALSAKAAVTLPKKRRFWVRSYLRCREAAGHASRLLPDLRAHDLEYFREFLAAGSTLRSISLDFRVGRSTACDVVADVCAALWDILKPLYLVSPQTADEWIKIAADFEQRWNFPHCMGAIDGKHMNVECPPNSGSLDRNYKGAFSKSPLAISDVQYRFMYIEFGHHGSDCDGGIFSRSRLLEQLEDGTFPLPCPSNVGDEGQLP